MGNQKMKEKYKIDTTENKLYAESMVDNLFRFGKRFPSPGGSSWYLGDDGRPGAEELLKEALDVFDSRFWDEKQGMTVDTWNTEFTILDDYRQIALCRFLCSVYEIPG